MAKTLTQSTGIGITENSTQVLVDANAAIATAAADATTKANAAQAAAIAASLPTSALDTDGTLAANSDSKVASQKAAKTYADTAASNAQAAAIAASVPIAAVGVANGVASLDSSGLVPAAQLPSYVDDVIEVADYASLPATGETGKIYITIDSGTQYRWSGSVYVDLVASPGTTDAVVEGSTNLYFTAARVLAVVLTGLSLTTNAAITATDTVLSALGKLQKQLTDLLARTTGTNTGDQTSVSGNAGTATTLATPRNIDGQAFDGSGDITVIAPGTHAATGKATPVDADELALVDSAASNVLKKLTWSNLKATLWAGWGALVNAGTAKTAPVDADAFAIMDSAASNATKSLTIANAKAAFKAPNVQSVTSSATITPTFSNDVVRATAQAAALTIANPTGTAVDGWPILFELLDNGTARGITFGSKFRGIGGALPITTIISKRMLFAAIYNLADDKWDVPLPVTQEV